MRKKELLLAFSAFVFLASTVFGQTETNKKALMEISQKMSVEYHARKTEALEFAKQNDIPVIFENDKGMLFELQAISEGGIPMYYISENRNAAKTISTDKVYQGGGAGLDLDGTGITPREWDGGAVRTTHQEFGGRVTQGDSPTSTHWHSTHVAGTIMASGVQSSAKGMAYNANLRAFDWNNDDSEMASEAANGALVSNHSYGFGRGWTWNGSSYEWDGNAAISTEEDYLFGFYDSESRAWDLISYNAPYYLIVKSAGNDRNEGPSNSQHPNDGPYDCIAHGGISKNVLTVGAVNDITGGWNGHNSVVMSSFSSWGPADDGRVKPDIVANGVGLYSCTDASNTSYTSSDGTSMSAPSATGSLALLQQHWENLNGAGNYMLSATLKGLVIHTADEAGVFDGPDYRFGWGLMNTKNAALRISEDQTINVIDELVLAQNGSSEMILTSDGSEDLKVTICWTDAPGTPVSAQLDPLDAMLVNDLDLRITNGDNTYYPWKLDRDNTNGAATNDSENNVDNVEVVCIENPDAGDYRVTIDHDGTLSGDSQAFSIIISGVTNTQSLPTASAGSDIEACENIDIQLEGTVANASSTIWQTTGDGTFDDITSLLALYTPGTADLQNGSVDISLTAYAIEPLNDSVIDNMIIAFTLNPISEAGDDVTVVAGEPAQLDGSAENYESTVWTSRGDGTFDDNTLLNAQYTPGTGDIADGQVKLSLVAKAIEPCQDDEIDNMYVNIAGSTIANAGDDGHTCGNMAYQLDGNAENYVTAEWSTSGDGSFNDATILNAMYTPSNNDITAGNVTLTLTVTNEDQVTVTDEMTLTVFEMPDINAGDDATTCENTEAIITGMVENQSSVVWSTTGDGTFADANMISTTYMPGTNDLVTGEVTLTFTAYFDEGCEMVSDNMLLTVQPNAIANAGNNDSVCKDGAYTLSGSAEYNGTILWSTNGDGTFVDASSLTTDYSPGDNDFTNGVVTLTLTAFPVEGCSQEASDVIDLQVINCSSIGENTAGNIDFSIVPNPAKGTFTINTDDFEGNSATITVMSVDGSIVYQQNHSSNNNKLNISINGSSFANGIYTVMIKSEKYSGISKLVIRN